MTGNGDSGHPMVTSAKTAVLGLLLISLFFEVKPSVLCYNVQCHTFSSPAPNKCTRTDISSPHVSLLVMLAL